MNLDTETCYHALIARDRRFDGVFFVGVTSTGVYCRPVCPARRPRRDRCRFFAQAASAEREGFRPCLRCRPELAPGHAPIDSPGRVAWRAIRRIKACPSTPLPALADDLGMSERQLRRLVSAEIGVSPVEFAQTSRLLLAKQLLTETRLPIARIAIAAGFKSLRRFNHTFVERYRLAPTRFRKAIEPAREVNEELRVALAYRPPLAWAKLVRFLVDHAIPGVEAVDAGTYARTLKIDGHAGWLRLQADSHTPVLWMSVSESLIPVLARVIALVRGLCDLDARPDVIDAHLGDDTTLASSVRAVPGLRVPGAIDGFELLWRTILGQQVSVKGATTLSGRVVNAIGEPIQTPVAGLTHLTPTAARIASLQPRDLQTLGITSSRAMCIIDAANAVKSGLRIEPGMARDKIAPELLGIRGIGPWTEAYVAMRGLAWPDAIPETDLFVRRAIKRLSARAIARWQPWRSYAVMHLWNQASNQT